jgi:hypothetical protein
MLEVREMVSLLLMRKVKAATDPNDQPVSMDLETTGSINKRVDRFGFTVSTWEKSGEIGTTTAETRQIANRAIPGFFIQQSCKLTAYTLNRQILV